MPSPGVQRGDVELGGARDARAGGAEIEAAGGLEMGDLAGALADALAGANVDDFGSYAAQDIAIDQEEASDAGDDQGAAMAERQALADRIAEIDTAIQGSQYASGFSPQDPYGTGGTPAVDDFASGGYATPGNQAGGMETFGFNPQHQTSPAFLGETVNVDTFSNMPATAPSPMTGPEMFGDWNQGVAQGYNFAGPKMTGDPTLAGSAGVSTGVESFANIPGVGTMATEEGDTPIGTAGQGGVSMSTPFNLAGGLINQGATATGPMESTGGQGAITAGTASASPETAAGEAAVAAGATTGDAAGTDFFGGDGNVGVATDSPAGTRMTGEEVNVYGKEQVDKSIMEVSSRLDQKAKAAREKYGTFSKEYQSAQRLANAFKSLDAYSKAYGATQGGSFLGSLLSGAMPFGAAVKSMQGWLTKQGMYSKQMGQDLLGILEKAMKDGNLNEVLRDLNQSGEGGMEAEMAVQEEVASFIQRYPWAAELDHKYIQYLIANPAELQDLLGQEKLSGGWIID